MLLEDIANQRVNVRANVQHLIVESLEGKTFAFELDDAFLLVKAGTYSFFRDHLGNDEFRLVRVDFQEPA